VETNAILHGQLAGVLAMSASKVKTWRLVTYNIHKGVAPFRSMDVIERVRVSLKESEADFLLLQEVVGERKLKRAQVENQLESLADQRWPYHAYGKNAIFPTRNHGNAILSAAPITHFHNKDLSVYQIEKRGLLHCELDAPVKGLHLCSVHLDLFEFTRKVQVDRLVAYIKKYVPTNAPLILGGDFNDWARKVGSHLEKELGVEELSARSFPSWHPILRLDRLYVRGIRVKKFTALEDFPWNRLSDHLPLYLEFQLKK
jgi:endonuclease/exonuclease/phosphatase family metal-dependent hydrolase